MNIHLVKVTAIAAALAFGALQPSAPADAAPKDTPSGRQQCEAAGHMWDSKKGCANKTCPSGGVDYAPGTTVTGERNRGGRSRWMCDGFSGAWEKIAS